MAGLEDSGDGASVHYDTSALVAEEKQRPVLFLHIPKTAGTSFLLMLQNAFADSRVRRLKTIDAQAMAAIDAISGPNPDNVSCLTGHLPIWLFNGRLDRFRPFTVLREPVSRVLSLFRFLLLSSSENLARLGLRPDSTLEEFLDSCHPELYAQINNGMSRILSGDRRLEDPDCPEFWDDEAKAPALDQAIGNLERLDFGLTEHMGETLKLARVCWAAPFTLREYKENATRSEDTRASAADIDTITRKNAHDLALYKHAELIFAQRMHNLPRPSTSQDRNPLAVFEAPPNESVSIANVAGRQGFHAFESDGLAWLHYGEPAEINFTLRPAKARLRMQVYRITPDYPAAEISIRINDVPLASEYTPSNGPWGWLETEAFEPASGVNRLEIEAPLFIDPKTLDPTSADLRRLGVALTTIQLTDAAI